MKYFEFNGDKLMSKFKQSSIALCIQTVFAASSLLAVQSVYAEEANTSEVAGLEVIEVTARKRVENVQEVPVAVSALTR